MKNPVSAYIEHAGAELRTVQTFVTKVRPRSSGANVALEVDQRWLTPAASLTGVRVTEDSSLGLTSVFSAVSLLASSIASLPIHIYRETGNSRESVKARTYQYLWLKPNPELTRFTFWELVATHEVLYGNAFILVLKNRDEEPLQLWALQPWRMRVGRTESGTKVYEYALSASGTPIVMKDFSQGGEIVHVPNFGTDGLTGMSPIMQCYQAIGLAQAADSYSARFFSQDSTPRGLITSEQSIPQEESAKLLERWERTNAGVAGAHRTSFLGNGAKFQQISVNPEDAELLEARRFQVAEIARIFHIPPHLLADVERSTSWGTGIAEQNRAFLTYSLTPHILRFEQAIDDALLRRGETNLRVKMDTGGLLRGTLKEQYEVIDMGIKGGFIAPNEGRADLDLSPLEGGDKLIVPVNFTLLEKLGETPSALPAPDATPDQPVTTISRNGSRA